YKVGVDGISLWLLALTAFITPLSVLASFTSIKQRVKEYYVLMLLLEAGMLGVFAARDLLLFYIFFEFTLIPLFFIIGIWGGPEKRYAARKFFIYTLTGSLISLVAIVGLILARSGLDGGMTFNLLDLLRNTSNNGSLAYDL